MNGGSILAAGEHPATTTAAVSPALPAPPEHAAPVGMAMEALTVGDRVLVVEVLREFDAVHHLMRRTGTVVHIDTPRPWAPYQVRMDNGDLWAFGRRSLQRID